MENNSKFKGSNGLEINYPNSLGYSVYTKNNCPFCDKVKQLLENDNILIIPCDDFLKNKNDKEEFLNFIESITKIKHKTFPMVFFDGKFIGGFTETKKYYEKSNAFSLSSYF